MITLDKFDNIILHTLSNEGRISNSKLAEKVGLSPSACLRRVKELENSKIIKGYRAILNREALDRNFLAYVTVGLSNHGIKSHKEFEKEILNASEVTECHNLAGAFEYLLRVEVKNTSDYKKFHAEVLGSLPQVNSITTYLVMDSPKDERGY
ncbi:MAG: Lrp/AsnC family transcriptional regulator [Glaciecola sp.]|jgi:DNA-binding Lrp family transcriptional regulator|nr:Lrp/AsnC family transcriptional regulator [Glaciecola sp.]MDG2099602.1 Lrp/AsnC family transcriptional regulator [Glaciecola sp.]